MKCFLVLGSVVSSAAGNQFICPVMLNMCSEWTLKDMERWKREKKVEIALFVHSFLFSLRNHPFSGTTQLFMDHYTVLKYTITHEHRSAGSHFIQAASNDNFNKNTFFRLHTSAIMYYLLSFFYFFTFPDEPDVMISCEWVWSGCFSHYQVSVWLWEWKTSLNLSLEKLPQPWRNKDTHT